jgi:hypothetical protein
MTDRTLTPGSGARVRQAYLRYLLIAGVVVLLVFMPVLATALTTAEGETVLTVVVGAAFVAVSSLLLLAALLRGRNAVTCDIVSLPAMRSSGALALAAQAAGWAGVAAALTLGVIQRLFDVDLAFTMGFVTAVCCAIPAVISDAARRLSRRLTR